MDNTTPGLFVYGTLMQGQRIHSRLLAILEAVEVEATPCQACTPGYLYDLGAFPALSHPATATHPASIGLAGTKGGPPAFPAPDPIIQGGDPNTEAFCKPSVLGEYYPIPQECMAYVLWHLDMIEGYRGASARLQGQNYYDRSVLPIWLPATGTWAKAWAYHLPAWRKVSPSWAIPSGSWRQAWAEQVQHEQRRSKANA